MRACFATGVHRIMPGVVFGLGCLTRPSCARCTPAPEATAQLRTGLAGTPARHESGRSAWDCTKQRASAKARAVVVEGGGEERAGERHDLHGIVAVLVAHGPAESGGMSVHHFKELHTARNNDCDIGILIIIVTILAFGSPSVGMQGIRCGMALASKERGRPQAGPIGIQISVPSRVARCTFA